MNAEQALENELSVMHATLSSYENASAAVKGFEQENEVVL